MSKRTKGQDLLLLKRMNDINYPKAHLTEKTLLGLLIASHVTIFVTLFAENIIPLVGYVILLVIGAFTTAIQTELRNRAKRSELLESLGYTYDEWKAIKKRVKA